MIIKRLGMKRDKNFEKLYALMGQDLGMDRMPYIVYQSDGGHWEKLLQYSERHYCFCEEVGLLFPVLHKIHWHMYPECEYTGIQKEILEVLEDVIRTDSVSKQTWIERDYFEHQVCLMLASHEAYTKAAPGYLSTCHEYYMNCKSARVFYGNNGLFSTVSEEDPYPELYESIIKEILPVTHTWSEENWLGEQKIYAQLATDYGLAYVNEDDFGNASDYDSLVYLLEQKRSGKNYRIPTLVGMKTCTMAMAAVLWPKNTEREMIKEFLRFGEVVLSGDVPQFARKDLHDCWLYKQVCKWMDKDAIPADLHHEVKKTRFNIELLGCC